MIFGRAGDRAPTAARTVHPDFIGHRNVACRRLPRPPRLDKTASVDRCIPNIGPSLRFGDGHSPKSRPGQGRSEGRHPLNSRWSRQFGDHSGTPVQFGGAGAVGGVESRCQAAQCVQRTSAAASLGSTVRARSTRHDNSRGRSLWHRYIELKTGTRLAPAKPRKQKSQQALTC